ncbi:MAG TPA: TonB-dependent receptor [Steroidobacteraceae bacterium]|nr:TonB-dependent receptor [Steroidobacteraceae bacterium]
MISKRLPFITGILLATGAPPVFADGINDPMAELSRMTLEQLAKVQVTSVSKTAQSLSTAPASIYVITHDEIVNSGAASIPEALRLAPNLQVEQFSSTDYEIGARGFGSNREAQNFSNKILILIDGRSVYNPLFSGVTYDSLDVVMEDVDRIEVISGPGATLWGSNAMNGVINIITRRASQTQGGLLQARGGEQEQGLTARYGSEAGGADYRVYAKALERGPSELANGDSARDRWNRVQAGFRVDQSRDADEFTVQGDVQRASFDKGAASTVDLTQYDILGRWQRQGPSLATRVQVYFDRTVRDEPPQGVGFDLDTIDFEFQQEWNHAGNPHRLVWGLGRRHNDYDIGNTAGLFFVPPSRTLTLTNVFAQDAITLSESFTLTAGIKFEDNSYSGWSTLPDLRLSWAPDAKSLVWIAAARAVRAPTPLDVDVRESFGGPPILFGDPDFETEKVWAYEIGYRAQPHPRVSWSLSTFYDDYDDLRSIEGTPGTFFPLRWDNLIEGAAYGVEAWANFQVTEAWRLSPGFRSLHKRLEFKEGGFPVIGLDQVGNDPRSQASLKSSLTFGALNFDAMLRYVGKLPAPEADDYTELSARLSWQFSESLAFSLSGFNLLDDSHLEYASPTANRIRRSIFAEARLNF